MTAQRLWQAPVAATQGQVNPEGQLAELSDYLRVESCVRGFSFLCQRLFGVSMTPVPLQPGKDPLRTLAAAASCYALA